MLFNIRWEHVKVVLAIASLLAMAITGSAENRWE